MVRVPAEELERIFELFTQVDQTLERAHGGLGIGLTLVKNLVELHGGSVYAESQGLGRGSTFRVQLPLATAAEIASMSSPEQAVAAPSHHACPLPCRRILVVGRHACIGQNAQLALEEPGTRSRDLPRRPFGARQNARVSTDAHLSRHRHARHEWLRSGHQTKIGSGHCGYRASGDEDLARPAIASERFDSGFDHHMIKPANLESLKNVIRGSCA